MTAYEVSKFPRGSTEVKQLPELSLGFNDGRQPMSGEAEYGLVMPFVVCQSKGGPYDDESYVAGYEAGRLDAALGIYSKDDSLTFEKIPYHTENTPQIDLIAMRHGLVATSEEIGEGWSNVTFRRYSLGLKSEGDSV